MWKLILGKCWEFYLTLKPKERNVFKKNNYNLIWLPLAEYRSVVVIPDNLGRNSSVDKCYAGKEVTAGELGYARKCEPIKCWNMWTCVCGRIYDEKHRGVKRIVNLKRVAKVGG
jgi:hypothetical protein